MGDNGNDIEGGGEGREREYNEPPTTTIPESLARETTDTTIHKARRNSVP